MRIPRTLFVLSLLLVSGLILFFLAMRNTIKAENQSNAVIPRKDKHLRYSNTKRNHPYKTKRSRAQPMGRGPMDKYYSKRIVFREINELGFEPIHDDTSKFWPMVPSEQYQHMTRAFRPWSYNHSWCQPIQRQTKKRDLPRDGLVLVKLHKAASSTLAGVVLRIAHHVGQRLHGSRHSNETTVCATRQNHVNSRKYANRKDSNLFVMGNIRDVASRELSHIFYRQEHKVSDTQLHHLLRTSPHMEWCDQPNGDLGYQLGYLNMQSLNENVSRVENKTNIHTQMTSKESPQGRRLGTILKRDLAWVQYRVQQVMDDYDFIFVAERMDESLIILQFLLDLDPYDLLYLSSKTAGSYRRGGGVCLEICKPKTLPANVEQYLSSQEWYARHYGDYLLYKTVNASLDKSIDAIGKDRFEKALETFRRFLARAQGQCSESAIFPCSKNGTLQFELSKQNCYHKDWGCGYPCLDQIV